MKKKGFTLVELLIVIAIIAILMSILMPTLAKVRAMAQRAVCSANLSNLHKSFLTYAQEHNDEYPRAGGKFSRWRALTQSGSSGDSEFLPLFYAKDEAEAFYQNPPNNNPAWATMGASLYYLIKYADASPEEYLCGGDRGAVEFELSLYKDIIPSTTRLAMTQDITLAWDFGGPPGDPVNAGAIPPAQHYSYAYHMPYGGPQQMYYSLSTMVPPDKPVMADRSPYLVLIRQDDIPPYEYGTIREKWGNSPNHAYEGQNVLYNNSSVKYETVPYCGLNQDNIYTRAIDLEHPQIGVKPLRSYDYSALPQSDFDSLLVNEGFRQGEVAE